MKVPPYIFDTDDEALDTMVRIWDTSDPAVSIAWITRGRWQYHYLPWPISPPLLSFSLARKLLIRRGMKCRSI
jgi:hypothetical protein